MADAHLYGLLFAAAVAAFCFSRLVGSANLAATQLLAILGDATCGWSWLLVRALFRPPGERRETWPLALVVAMVMLGAVLRMGEGDTGPLLRIAENAESLVSAALLLLATVEPLRGMEAGMPQSEKRFRIGFAAGYTTILLVAVLLIDGAPPASAAARFGGTIKAFCALTALAGMGFAIRYRTRNPLSGGARGKRRPAAAADASLGERLRQVMDDGAAFAQPDLKVADLARLLGEADYKVSRCITGVLGFSNFNQMANHVRLAEAKRRLSDPQFDHLPILTIALDCGFGSIGPFNRAFKQQTGTTPKAFRTRRPA
jgi:AraC-like DNA-binding protein